MGTFKDQEFQMETCLGKHGSYTFYKSIRVGSRTYSLSNFLPVRIWPDSAILSIAEVQLLWKDRNESLASLRLYFLPENTPFGRFSFHGEDEVIALQDKVIIRASDLMSWLVDEEDWDWGYLTPKCEVEQSGPLQRAFQSERYEKEDKLVEFQEPKASSVVVLNYDRYVRLRTILKRLEGSKDLDKWLKHPLVMAIGAVGLGPNSRLLFARDVFDYPELEDHELLCNHLAPKLKGKQGRKKRRNRHPSMGSVSNESESSSTASSASVETKMMMKPNRQRMNGLSGAHHGHGQLDSRLPQTLPLSRAARIMEERGLEALQRELLLSTNANGLQILKVDSSHHGLMPRNGQLSSSSGNSSASRRHYSQQQQQSRRVVDSRGGHSSGSSSGLEFGPGLNELAQKLKRSNALQILAIQPPLGAGLGGAGAHGQELDMFQLKKRMKLDPEQQIISQLLGGSDLYIHPLNSGPFTSRKQTIYAAPIIDKVVSKTHEVVKQLVGANWSQKSSTNKRISSQMTEKPKKEPVTPANIDQDLREFMSIRHPSTVDSPFRRNNRIYGSPTSDRRQLQASEGSSSHSSESVLDFSLRKSSKQQQSSSSSSGAESRRSRGGGGAQEPVDLLDLTIKPTSSASSGGLRGHHHHLQHNEQSGSGSAVYGGGRGSGANIPLPNQMDKLGLQLTSEVTLFPSPSYMGKVKENKSVKMGGGGQSSGGGGTSILNKMMMHQQQQQGSHHHPHHQHPHHHPQGGNTSSSGERSSSRSSSSSNKSLKSSATGAPSGSRQASASPKDSSSSSSRHHQSSYPSPGGGGHYPNHLNQKSVFGHPGLSGSGSSSSGGGHSSSSAITIKPMSSSASEEKAKLKELEKAYQSLNAAGAAAGAFGLPGGPGNPFGIPTGPGGGGGGGGGGMPKMDPAYLSLLTNPFLMSPQALMSIPGAIEQFQMYKDLFQQSGIPQFPMHWPPGGGPGPSPNERGGGK